MKVYYLRFTEGDFIKSGSIWTTPVVDLYSNSQYKNYSTTKSSYGLDSLGTGVWTGLGETGPTTTDYGFIDGGRFVDTSSRIDIVDWQIRHNTGLTGAVPLTLSVYTSESNDNSYLGDWSQKHNLVSGSVIFEINSPRFAFFQINWNVNADLSAATCEVFVRVEIDSPGVSAYFPETIKLQNKLPEWMAMREYDPSDPLSENKATPESLGGKFLNAVAGEWLNDIRGKITYTQFQSFVETVDTSQKAWVYQTNNTPSLLYSISGDGVQLARVSSISEFYEATEDEDVFFWNEGTNTLFSNKQYTSFQLNGSDYAQSLYQVWNAVDDIGVTVDLFRLRSETNDNFKKRILDVYKNRPGVSPDAFKKALRRELNLWKYSGATPDSDFQGATPEVLEISDLENDPDYFDYDGMPKAKFIDLVNTLAIRYPMTWGYFKYGSAFWDSDGLEHEGIQEVPRRFDAEAPSEEYIDSGVGDGNDLYIMRPGAYTGAREFSAQLKLRGRSKQSRLEYSGLVLETYVYGVADEVSYSNSVFQGNFTLELTIGGIVYFHNFTMSAQNNQSYWQSTPSFESYAMYTWLNENMVTNYGLDLKKKTDGASFVGATPYQASIYDITSVTIQPGHWSVSGATYTGAPTAANYRLWFSDNSSSKMGSGGGSFLTISSFNSSGRNPTIVLESLVSTSLGTVSEAWQSTKFKYTVKLNGAPPGNSVKNFTITPPPIPWPQSTSNRKYVVEIITSDGTNYGAYTNDAAGSDQFVPSSIINVNGSNSWTSGKQSFTSSTPSLVFSTGTNGSYPATVSVWAPFEQLQTIPFTGTVDENGPWRNGEPQFYGNVSYVLDYFNVNRTDFGIPNTVDYIVTWIGIANVNDPQIIVWTETNTVKPAVTDSTEVYLVEYPENSIEEVYDSLSGEYTYPNIVVKARYKPGVVEEWYPKAYSGYFYDDVEDYYMYAQRQEESATGSYKVLPGLNRLGAPVIVQGMRLSTPSVSATPAVSAQAISGLTAWYDASNIGLADNTLVTTWNDSHSTARHIQAIDTTAKPTFKLNQFPSLLPGVVFNGTDDYLGGDASGTPQLDDLITTSAYEVYTVFILHAASETSADNNAHLNEAIWTDQQGVVGLYVSSNGPRAQVYNWSGSANVGAGVPITYNEPHVALIRHEAGTYYISVDGGPESSVSSGNTDLSSAFNKLNIGRNKTSDNKFANVTIGEICFYNTNHLQADRDALIDALTEKWINPPEIITEVAGELRQVYLWKEDATPTLGHEHSEIVYGTGTNVLYASYDDLYNISAIDLTTNEAVDLLITSTGSNQVTTIGSTNTEHLYQLTYTVARSFYVDNDFIDSDKSLKSYVHFDSTPNQYGFDYYDIYYEGSKYDPATPIDIPLNTFYTSIDEGFIYIDHDVHNLSKTELRINPGKVMADGFDYALITLRTFDVFGNPKPYKTYNLYTNFGTLDKTQVTTDRDGFAYTTLQSYKWGHGSPYPTFVGMPAATPNLSGSRGGQILVEAINILEYDGDIVDTPYLETIDGGDSSSIFDTNVDGGDVINESPNTANVSFSIYTSATPNQTLAAVPSADQVPANGASEIYIYGQVKNSAHKGVPAAVVFWRKDRFLYDLFNRTKSNSNAVPGKAGKAGKVIADANGRFRVGPFVAATPSDPGTWLVAVESNYSTPVSGSTPYYDAVGDIVYWYEYTDTSFGVENIYGVPKAPVQYATPSWRLPSYSYGSAFPVRYDEANYQATPEDPGIEWQPPAWYSIDKYKQYQMGILGNDYWTLEAGATPNFYPDYKEF